MSYNKASQWKKVEYTTSQINKAGRIIKRNNLTIEERKKALEVIDNWRAAHAYPLHVFYIKLKRIAKNNTIVAQRLKRLESIIGKLSRIHSMSLWKMQDLGGCRVIVKSIKDVYKCRDLLINSKIKHEFNNESDYISNPKDSGYRSLHVVYKFHSDKIDYYNNNMLIEIQFRTLLQHSWATAVETMGMFKHEDIKSGKGSEDVNRFFLLVSSLFAIEEQMPLAPNTPLTKEEIINEIRALDSRCNFLDFLSNIKVITELEKDSKHKSKNDEYWVLSLNYEEHSLHITPFKQSDINKANEYYSQLENSKDSKTDSVLVQVSSFKELRKAYPNYFYDISLFVNRVRAYIKSNEMK